MIKETDNNTKSEIEREEIDPIFKDVLIFSFGQLEILIQTQVEVSRLPRTMDVLILLKQSNELQRVRSETLFSYFRVHNQVELKGKSDRLTRAGYHLILGRANLYLAEEDISAKEMTVTIISARKPINVLRHCPDDVRWEEIAVGHYVSTDILPVHLIVVNELPIEPKYYPLLLFTASKEKFRQFLEPIVKEDNSVYIYYAYRIDPELTKEVLDMAGKSRSYQKNLEFIAQDIGKELIPFLSAEDRVRGLTLEERLSGLPPEDLVRVLTPEERRKLKQLLEEEVEKDRR
ncbi:hypothetical protein H8E77_16775 [bacterium]|nr:hypothetical protein [bacterium]